MSDFHRVERPVSEASARSLEVFKNISQDFPHINAGFRPRHAATLIESKESSRKRKKANDPITQPLHNVMYPIPQTGAEPLTLKVNDFRFLGRSLGRRSLSLILDDSEDILAEERAYYVKRMNKAYGKFLVPHVSVLDIEYAHSLKDILEWAESIAPQTITLDPLVSRPHIVEPTPKKTKSPSPDTPPIKNEMIVNEIVVRDITKSPPFPAGFLSVLKNSHDTNSLVGEEGLEPSLYC